jgi:hypothetical protein
MGMGIGAAMTGLRPIVEGMNMGFLLLAFNQISNNCGMLHYTSGGQYKVLLAARMSCMHSSAEALHRCMRHSMPARSGPCACMTFMHACMAMLCGCRTVLETAHSARDSTQCSRQHSGQAQRTGPCAPSCRGLGGACAMSPWHRGAEAHTLLRACLHRSIRAGRGIRTCSACTRAVHAWMLSCVHARERRCSLQGRMWPRV